MDDTAVVFQEIRSQRVFESICEQVREQIATGVLRAGDKLPTERDLAAGFRVSRPAVREALRILESCGVVRLVKGARGGAFIASGGAEMLTQAIQDLLFLGRLSAQDLKEARELIHGVIVQVACARGTEADFDAIERNIEAMALLAEPAARQAMGIEFFRLIAKATSNQALVLLVDAFGAIIRTLFVFERPTVRPELVAARRRVLAAMRGRNVQAAADAMWDYVDMSPHGSMRTPRGAATPVAETVRRNVSLRLSASQAARPAAATSKETP